MSVFNEAEFKEGLVSELSVFNLPNTQTSVTDVYYDEIRPLSQVSDDSPFEFKISGQNSIDYVDLKNSQIYVRLKVEKADGTALTKGAKVGPANLFLQALFSSIEGTLQNKATVNCNYNPYRAYIHTLLKYGTDAIKSQFDTQLFIQDDADNQGVTDPSGTNNGLYERANTIAESKRIDLQGPIFHDLFSMSRYLLNQVDVKIKLHRSPNNFCLLTGDANDYRVNIEDIYIMVKKSQSQPRRHLRTLKNSGKAECTVPLQ